MQKTARLINALQMRLNARKQEALAHIEIMLSDSVAVANHTNFSSDVEEHIQEIAKVDGMLNAIASLFPPAPQTAIPVSVSEDNDE